MKAKYIFTNLLFVCILALSLSIPLTSKAQLQLPDGIPKPCFLADLTVKITDVQIVNDNTIKYMFQIKNIGISDLYLDRMSFQAYLCKTTEIDYHYCVGAGGAQFGDNIPPLKMGETYTDNFTCTLICNCMQAFPYLILTVNPRSGYSMPECSIANNTATKKLTSYFGDIQLERITILSAATSGTSISCTVTNIGNLPIDISSMYYDIYYSKNATYNAESDILAATVRLKNTIFYLESEESHTQTITITPSFLLEDYPYLIAIAKTYPNRIVYEKTTTNNIRSVRVTLSPNLARFQVAATEDIVTIADVSENAVRTSYVMYNMNGEMIREGTFEGNESFRSNLTSGIYIVKITDGIHNETYKIQITE